MRLLSPYAAIFALAGCSLINSFDDVKPEALEAGATGGKGGKGGAESGGAENSGGSDAGSDASAGGTPSSGGKGGTGGKGTGGKGGAGGGAGGGGGGAGGTGDGGPSCKPGGPNGALVTYNGAAAEKKLYVLDPDTGKPLAPGEPMERVRAIVNDGASDPTDKWYIIEGAPDPTDQSAPVNLHVRQLDAVHGCWLETGTLNSVPPPSSKPVTFGSSSSYLAYLTDPNKSSSSGSDANLVLIDVTDPTKPALVKLDTTINPLPAGRKQGLMADQSSINVVILQDTTACTTNDAGVTVCEANFAHYLVGSGGTVTNSGVLKPIGHASGSSNVNFIVDQNQHRDIVALPPLNPPTGAVCTQNPATSGLVKSFTNSTADPLGTGISIPMAAPQFPNGGPAFDTCDNILFLTTLISDFAIWAVPIGGGSGSVTKLCTGQGGTRMLFDPYTRTLWQGVGTDFVVYTVDATTTPPTLKNKVLSDVPAGFQFGAAAFRSPIKPNCGP